MNRESYFWPGGALFRQSADSRNGKRRALLLRLPERAHAHAGEMLGCGSEETAPPDKQSSPAFSQTWRLSVAKAARSSTMHSVQCCTLPKNEGEQKQNLLSVNWCY